MLFFFSDTATTEIYTLSLRDALPIFATPAETHFALAMDCLEAGVDVLVEKPLALHVREIGRAHV